MACYYGAGDIVKILLPRDDGIANKENDVSNNMLSSFQLVFISPFSYLLSVVHFIIVIFVGFIVIKAGLTPLMIAIKRQHVEVVRTLAQCASVDVNYEHKVDIF